MDPTASATPDHAAAPRRIAPGPAGRFLLGSIPEMRSDPMRFFVDSVRAYGDVVRLQLVKEVHLLNHPDHIKHVLQDNHVNYLKGFGYERMEPLVGKGLLTSEGDFWKRQRRLAQPAFHRQRIAAFASIMVRRTEEMLAHWRTLGPDGEVDAHAEMMRLTLGVVGEALFSIDLVDEAEATGEALRLALEIINDRFAQFFVFPRAVPTPENLKLYRAIDVLESLVNGILAKRRAGGGEAGHGDLLQMFLEARDTETGETMNDRQLRDEVMTMVLAGHETTANALAWTFALLSQHPDVERRLHAEVSRVLAGRQPSLEDLPKLEYLTQVLNESMRLYPPAWFIGRKAIADDVIGGYHIPAGSTVFLVPWLTHRDSRFWENPEGFDPERFSAAAMAARPKLAFFPFAAGPRMCIGNAFAMMEMQLVLARVVQHYRLELLPNTRVEMDPQVTLRPKFGVPVRLREKGTGYFRAVEK